MSTNPFPGPRPYTEKEGDRFFGREDALNQVSSALLAYRVITLFGPSGAGKSSLMRAAVLPSLARKHRFRVVAQGGWPALAPPAEILVASLAEGLRIGAKPEGEALIPRLTEVLLRAEQRSDRPILICLDQLEQILLPDREASSIEDFFEALDHLAARSSRGVHMVLALREDYLGRFRDCARGRRRLLAQSVRLGPLRVGEMLEAVCRAADEGTPSQTWSEKEIRPLLLEVRDPDQPASDESEVQAAYGQIVCRALWDQRDREGGGAALGPARAFKAQEIVNKYLAATIDSLGVYGHEALRFLEEELITDQGRRRLVIEEEANKALSEGALGTVLGSLEKAAILRLEWHGGSRYFELGHDWLANELYIRRKQREESERKQRERQKAARRVGTWIAVFATMVALVMGALFIWALKQRDAAKEQRDVAKKEKEAAQAASSDALMYSILSGAREMLARKQAIWANRLLLEVKKQEVQRWNELALEVLRRDAPFLTLTGQIAKACSPDGERLVTARADGAVRVRSVDGGGARQILSGHTGPINAAAWSLKEDRIVTASEDGTARIWSSDDSVKVLEDPDKSPVGAVAWSPDGKHIVTGSADGVARVWSADGEGAVISLRKHQSPIHAVAWSSDGGSIVTVSVDGTALLWSTSSPSSSDWFNTYVLSNPESIVVAAAWSPKDDRIAIATEDRAIRIGKASEWSKAIELRGHERTITSIAWSPKSYRIVSASSDGTARVWRTDGTKQPIAVLDHHGKRVESASFSADGARVLTASEDKAARVWPADGGNAMLILRGHEDTILTAGFCGEGDHERVVASAADATVRIWLTAGAPPVGAAPPSPGIVERLNQQTTACLPLPMRVDYLLETEDAAQAGYAACERAHPQKLLEPIVVTGSSLQASVSVSDLCREPPSFQADTGQIQFGTGVDKPDADDLRRRMTEVLGEAKADKRWADSIRGTVGRKGRYRLSFDGIAPNLPICDWLRRCKGWQQYCN